MRIFLDLIGEVAGNNRMDMTSTENTMFDWITWLRMFLIFLLMIELTRSKSNSSLPSASRERTSTTLSHVTGNEE